VKIMRNENKRDKKSVVHGEPTGTPRVSLAPGHAVAAAQAQRAQVRMHTLKRHACMHAHKPALTRYMHAVQLSRSGAHATDHVQECLLLAQLLQRRISPIAVGQSAVGSCRITTRSSRRITRS